MLNRLPHRGLPTKIRTSEADGCAIWRDALRPEGSAGPESLQVRLQMIRRRRLEVLPLRPQLRSMPLQQSPHATLRLLMTLLLCRLTLTPSHSTRLDDIAIVRTPCRVGSSLRHNR